MIWMRLLFGNSVSSRAQADDSVTDTTNPEKAIPVKDLFCSLVPWTQHNASRYTSDGLIFMGHIVPNQ